jgi:hypothetical protein
MEKLFEFELEFERSLKACFDRNNGGNGKGCETRGS